MKRIIVIETCSQCPFYKEENNYMRHGSVGFLSKCNVQDGKELYFTDKMDVPKSFDEIHESCKLDKY